MAALRFPQLHPCTLDNARLHCVPMASTAAAASMNLNGWGVSSATPSCCGSFLPPVASHFRPLDLSVQCSSSSSTHPLGRPSNVIASASSSANSYSVTVTSAPAAGSISSKNDVSESPADFCGREGMPLLLKACDGDEEGESHACKKFHIHTFGCQMNMADSERMAGILEAMGYRWSDVAEEADVLVYNTCSIRDRSEQKVYSAVGTQRGRKRRNPDMRIVVAGCVAQQEAESLLRRIPEVDLVMGPQHANRLQELLEQVEEGGSQVVATDPIHIMEDITKPRRDSKVTAWVNVIYGCNERCTYCVVPNTRGTEQSREPEAIRREIMSLAEAGYKEVTLLGQNIDAYGRDLPGSAADGSGRRRWTLTDLLLYVHDVPGIERIRFATSHPRYFSERLIRMCAELPKVCKFFHIPFQSGDNQILQAMARGYSRERYLDIIAKIRAFMPDAAISADVIVGFPGETEEQFHNTLRLLEEVKFDQVNTAAYSPRPNTPAALREDQVAELIKMDRLQRINKLVLFHCLERNQRYMGRVETVLVEAQNPKPGQQHQVMGRTDTNRLTFFPGPTSLIGQIVDVRITEVRAVSLTGEQLLPAGST
eukprot:TRINITY_DN13884_c0_g1_i1.p1 TRINITY_DN13884_c0_g1~~TRINITY_DN13884_c0_g1_i1.p1  ORF type:complete len:608 (-),score=136.71 TRINITY_DN13884_c0_g1_i1:232-2019(-)